MIYIRCKKCKFCLAGPLTMPAKRKNSELGFFDYFMVNDTSSDLDKFNDFKYQEKNDLVTHPQWLDSWISNWNDISDGASIRKMNITTDGYGCCGPIGKTYCSCKEELGSVFADCYGIHWMLFFSKKIDRSDTTDGKWSFISDSSNKHEWIENIGFVKNGLKDGEWEEWKVTSSCTTRSGRDKNRLPTNTLLEEIDKQLIDIQSWKNGHLTENSKINDFSSHQN